MGLDHVSRRKWCDEISDINRSLNPSKKDKETNMFNMRPGRY